MFLRRRKRQAIRKTSVLVGIAGGTGSGKTTVAERLRDVLGAKYSVNLVQQDAYYRDRSQITPEEREVVDYDHPHAIEFDLLIQHLRKLKSLEPCEIPQYDFKTHTRLGSTLPVQPVDLVLVEGILILVDKELRNMFDYKIFVDTPDDIRLIRRIQRDMSERGRVFESIIKQYLETVRPAHSQFVEPSKQYADIIIPEGGYNTAAIEVVANSIMQKLKN